MCYIQEIGVKVLKKSGFQESNYQITVELSAMQYFIHQKTTNQHDIIFNKTVSL